MHFESAGQKTDSSTANGFEIRIEIFAIIDHYGANYQHGQHHDDEGDDTANVIARSVLVFEGTCLDGVHIFSEVIVVLGLVKLG